MDNGFRKVLGICSLGLIALGMSAGVAKADSGPAGAFKKVFIIVLENEDSTVASSEAYLGSLMSRGAYLKNFHGVVHPSQGNYFALTAGDFLGQSGIFGDFT